MQNDFSNYDSSIDGIENQVTADADADADEILLSVALLLSVEMNEQQNVTPGVRAGCHAAH